MCTLSDAYFHSSHLTCIIKIPSIVFPHNRTARTTDELSAFLSKPLYHKSHRKIKLINQSPHSPFEMIQRNSTTCLEILNIDIPNS